MTIVKTTVESNGAYVNQNGEFASVPDGYISIPDEFISAWEQYKPFVTIAIENGVIASIEDNPTARAAQKAIDDAAQVEQGKIPTDTERLRADVDYLAMVTGVEL